MLFSLRMPNRRFAIDLLLAIVLLLPAVFASVASAQLIPGPPACVTSPFPFPGASGDGYALYPATPLTYPLPSNEYTVQYQLDGGTWTDATIYINRYGGSNSSPYVSYSGYTQTTTSMSFVSIPAYANANVLLRVTKLLDAPFLASDQVSVRPSTKGIATSLSGDGSVQIARSTGPNFDGEQFILWWNRDSDNNGGIQGLAFFLDPPYDAPTTGNIKTITSGTDLTGDLSAFVTLIIQGTVTIAMPGSVEPPGAQAFVVPANIVTIFLAPGSWLQGKLAFQPAGGNVTRKLYGPGVLDASRFEYDLRQCDPNSGYAEQGYAALAALNPNGNNQLKNIAIDGIIISDNDFYATDRLTNSSVNNTKVIAWNANNDGLEFGFNTTASNVFVRSGDDSLKLWDSSDKVTNATVWQNYNGGVVNIGWSDDEHGDNGLIDGLYVVKTDWTTPTAPTFMADQDSPVAHQNNAVIASMMVPGTLFGSMVPSTYRNIFIEDPPQVLLSLKIIPPRTNNPANDASVILTALSTLNLDIYNVFTPPSTVANSIGFQILPPGFTFFTQTFPDGYVLTGNMNISLTNVMLVMPDGTTTLLTSAIAFTPLGKVWPNGDNVNVVYDSDIFANGFE
jgi:hypothetical protein